MKRKYVLMLLVLLIQYVLCGYSVVGEYSNVKMEVQESYDTEYSEFGTLQIDGKYITLPCKAELLIDLGFEPEKEIKLKPGYIISSVWFQDTRGNKLVVSLFNDSSSAKSISECDVFEIDVEYLTDVKSEIDFNVMEVKLGDSVADANLKWGEASYKGDAYNGLVSRYYENKTKNREIRADFDMSDNCCRIQVSAEYPEHKGYQSIYDSTTYDSNYDDYDLDYDVEYTESRGSESKVTSVLTWIIVFFLCVGMPLIIIGFVIYGLVKLFGILGRDMSYEFAAASEKRRNKQLELTHKILNTDIEDLADDINEARTIDEDNDFGL